VRRAAALSVCEFLISEEDVLGARYSSGASFSLFAAPYDASLELFTGASADPQA
jgi:hypothetical protein